MKVYLLALFLMSSPDPRFAGRDGTTYIFESKAKCEEARAVLADSAKARFGPDFKLLACKSIDRSKLVEGRPVPKADELGD